MTWKLLLDLQRQAFDNLTTGIAVNKVGKKFRLSYDDDPALSLADNEQYEDWLEALRLSLDSAKQPPDFPAAKVQLVVPNSSFAQVKTPYSLTGAEAFNSFKKSYADLHRRKIADAAKKKVEPTFKRGIVIIRVDAADEPAAAGPGQRGDDSDEEDAQLGQDLDRDAKQIAHFIRDIKLANICVACGVATQACYVIGGRHIELTAMLLRMWAEAMVAERKAADEAGLDEEDHPFKITTTTPPQRPAFDAERGVLPGRKGKRKLEDEPEDAAKRAGGIIINVTPAAQPAPAPAPAIPPFPAIPPGQQPYAYYPPFYPAYPAYHPAGAVPPGFPAFAGTAGPPRPTSSPFEPDATPAIADFTAWLQVNDAGFEPAETERWIGAIGALELDLSQLKKEKDPYNDSEWKDEGVTKASRARLTDARKQFKAAWRAGWRRPLGVIEGQ